MAGYTLLDKKRSSDIGERLGIFNINDKLTKCKKWIGGNIYKEWMTTDYPKKINYKPEERRNIGRPQTRWEDDFREEGTGQAA